MQRTKKFLASRGAILALLALFACAGSSARAQEKSPALSSPNLTKASPGTPVAALRDLLSAACSQSEEGFAKFLTSRNAQSFAHLTAAARVALMKRLVLLDEPGKPSVTTNEAGRPTVRCEGPALATEMRIGGPVTEDNLAFLPLEIRNAADRSAVTNNNDDASPDAREIQIGLVHDSGGWKLLSVGLLLLDLPSLEIEWNRASMDQNERDAIRTLKEVAKAIETYRRTYTKLPGSLSNLGPPAKGASTSAAAGLVDAELAAGSKSGYTFRYVIVGASAVGAPARYALAATPLVYGTTGRRSFFVDENGFIHGADRQGALAGPSDPRVE
ncbi:MAG: hypothetical protein DMG33_09490 [Acidobacteria bacterium]|nr:MAG: hypothetical protein DMG33_09490 [Acidobacteriota bacterium]